MSWFPQFLVLYALGCLAAAQLAPPAQIGQYFHRFMALVAAGLSGTALALVRAPEPVLIAAAGCAIGAWITGSVTEGGRAHRVMRVALGLGLVAATGLFVALGDWREPILLTPVQALASGAFLGATLTAMIAGHFYLKNARLPIEILIRLCRTVVATGILAVGLSLALFWAEERPIQRLVEFYERGLVLEALLPAVRVLASGVFALILAFMALSCAKIRSNQSATGILYALVGVVLIGEMTSHYMTHVVGLSI